MAKYVFDIDTENPYVDKSGNKVYMATSGAIYEHVVMKGLEPLTPEYINEHFSDLHEGEYEVAYQEGIEDMHEAIKKIANMSAEERNAIFGAPTLFYAISEYTANGIVEKLQTYEEKKKANERIMFGDGLVTKRGDMKGMALSNEVNGSVHVWREDCVTYEANVKEWKKTGETFPELVDLLKKMKGGAE